MAIDENDPNFDFKTRVSLSIMGNIGDTMLGQGLDPNSIELLGKLQESATTRPGFVNQTLRNIFFGKTDD